MRTHEDHAEAVRRMEKLSREIWHYIRLRCGCPLCYQIGIHADECPSRK